MKKLFFSLLLVAGVAFGGFGLSASVSAADPTQSAKQQACQGINGQTGGSCGTGGVDLSKIIKAVLNILSVIAGIAGVIMVVVSGLRYITSGGDAQAVSGAKRTLIYAIVGLVVVSVSQLIVRFVLSNVD